jgi:RHS repeat-associated protein
LIDENGSITTNLYDGLNRVIRRQAKPARASDPHPAGGVKDTKANWQVIGTTLQELEYDGLSRLTRSLDNNFPDNANDDAIVTRAYDSLSRLLEEVQNGLPVSSRWSGSDDRLGLVYPNGRTLAMGYDPLGRINTVTDTKNGLIADFDFLGPVRVLERTYGNGVKLSFLDSARQKASGYDAGPRVVELKHLAKDGSLVAGFSYGYDRTNNRLFELRQHERVRDDFTYDSLDRLTVFARQGQRPTTWQLDGANNWAQSQGQANQVNALHEYEQFEGKKQAYDENGNLLENGTFRFQYDVANRLRRVLRASDSALIAEYLYDAQGRRTSKTVSNSGKFNGTVRFFYDGWQEIEERKGNQVQQYVYSAEIDQPLALIQDQNGDGTSEKTFYYYQDDQLNVAALTDATGKVVERITYDAYGVPSLAESVVGNPFLYTARRYEPEIGQYYFRARFYDPKQGRFLQRAPEPSWTTEYELGNPYVYAYNSPVNRIDPLGLPTHLGKREVILKSSVTGGASSCGATGGRGFQSPQETLNAGGSDGGSGARGGLLWGTGGDGVTGGVGSPCVCPTAAVGWVPILINNDPGGGGGGGGGGGSQCPAGEVFVCVTFAGTEYCGCVTKGGGTKGGSYGGGLGFANPGGDPTGIVAIPNFIKNRKRLYSAWGGGSAAGDFFDVTDFGPESGGGGGGGGGGGTGDCCGVSCSCDPPPPPCCGQSCSCAYKPGKELWGFANPSGDPTAAKTNLGGIKTSQEAIRILARRNTWGVGGAGDSIARLLPGRRDLVQTGVSRPSGARPLRPKFKVKITIRVRPTGG